MTRVIVLGCGRIGRTIARDLASDFEVTAVDHEAAALDSAFADTAVRTLQSDLSNPDSIRAIVEGSDIVVGALPGAMGYRSLEAVLRAGKPVADISFFPEDPFELDGLARDAGVAAVVDMGLAPGMSNAILGRHFAEWARVDSFECLVGGLPAERVWPFEYKAPFSPADVIEEYLRPARFVEGGAPVVRPALSDPERVYFEGVGTLEAFNTDGLRTLTRTYGVPNMREKTLRYPGHCELMRVFRESGFFGTEPLILGASRVRPIDLTSRLLFDRWALKEGEEEFTVMRVTVSGRTAADVEETRVWNLLDRYDRPSGTTSMARTTGYACAAAVHLLARGRVRGPGIVPPERLGEDRDCFRLLLDYQRARGVRYESTAAVPPR
jgi:lysine 6-dehydrogenase